MLGLQFNQASCCYRAEHVWQQQQQTSCFEDRLSDGRLRNREQKHTLHRLHTTVQAMIVDTSAYLCSLHLSPEQESPGIPVYSQCLRPAP